ncbi:transcription factor iiib 70 kDa subunit [Phtheirospermum japonicum]|uniref:Transcription factor iiib 70 kDa subunit n=1 Tax=Phtheirospermum japonicum TaxID=374723 RepID=A0A830CI95_9LAMI|nr:transcription factor iiib 70 kDa subunit [Phtheirospermum japonicum]
MMESSQLAMLKTHSVDDNLASLKKQLSGNTQALIGVERNFTRWSKERASTGNMPLHCLENKKPYLLIDFSEHLRINVYVLGAVFLQLCKLLSLEEHPIIQKPVDPSLFIHRFTDRKYESRSVLVYISACYGFQYALV